MKVDIWPHNVDEGFKGKGTRFMGTVATVKRVMRRRDDNQPIGLKFNEDTNQDGDYTGYTWWFTGNWNEDEGAYDDYTGYVPDQGESVEVVLRTLGDRHNVVAVRPYSGSNGHSAPEPQQSTSDEPVRPVDPLQQRINLGMAYNNATVRLAALDQLVLNFNTKDGEITPFNKPDWYETLNSLWWHWFSESSRGLPLTPVPEDMDLGSPGVLEDAAELDEQAEAHMSEELPWETPPEEAHEVRGQMH